MSRWLFIALGFALLTSSTAFGQSGDVRISTSLHDEEGEYLVDGTGMSLYLFKADTQGADGRPAVSACNDAPCIGTWPPLLIDQPAGDNRIDARMLGVMTRNDGTSQVTYNGWPLYYYYEDARPGDILGDDIESFGEDWYLIGPHGNRAGKGTDDY